MEPNLEQTLKALARNAVRLEIGPGEGRAIGRFGGAPDVPEDFAWPRFVTDAYVDDEVKPRSLTFLCQFDCAALAELDRDGLLAAGTPEALLELAPQFETDSGGMVAVSVEAAVMEPMLVRRISGLADRQAAMDLLAGALGQRLPAMEVRPFGSELLLTPVRT